MCRTPALKPCMVCLMDLSSKTRPSAMPALVCSQHLVSRSERTKSLARMQESQCWTTLRLTSLDIAGRYSTLHGWIVKTYCNLYDINFPDVFYNKSLIHWFSVSLIDWFVNSLIHLSIDWLIHWFIHSFIHSFIHYTIIK